MGIAPEVMPLKPPIIERWGLRSPFSPLVGLFLTVFLDLLSFGLFIPDLQLRGRELGATGIGLGAALGVYSLAQLISAPLLGRLSDSRGRRSVLLICTSVSVVSYLIYAHAGVLWVMILSRAVLGFAAASVGVAFAYVADVTAPADRSKGLGLMGAAFGLGFIVGPVAGGLLIAAGHNRPLLLGYVGAALSLANFLYILILLPESLKVSTAPATKHPLAQLRVALATPGLPILLLMFFAINLGFTNLESTFFQLLADSRSVFHLDHTTARQYGSYILGCVGVVSVFTQGVLVRRFTPRFGEVRLLRVFLFVMVPALVLVPFSPLWLPALLCVAVLGLSMGLTNPNLSSLISQRSPATLQGGVFGVTQSLGAVARLVGPLVSNTLFGWAPWAPYALGGAVVLVPAILSWRVQPPAESGPPRVDEAEPEVLVA